MKNSKNNLYNFHKNKMDFIFINSLASLGAGAPALKYGYVNTETHFPEEVKGKKYILYIFYSLFE